MNYEETLEYLYNTAPMFQKIGTSAYKEGMDNSFLIDAHLQHPHSQYKTIHVGGTNGKGSTSHLLASVLQESGYKVGLYTSPHLLDFRERIKINGEMIEKSFVVDFIATHKDYFETLQASFFELTTGMAFAYFAAEKVDVAIIEVGLGGRLDCTNVITPVLSIITNISLDHTNLLGSTEEKIAREKAGIIKAGIPVVIGEAEGLVRNVFENSLTNNGIFVSDQNPILSSQHLPSGYWQFETAKYPELVDELGGYAQEKNAATVLCALDVLQNTFTISDEAVLRGFRSVVKNTGLMGRWQIIQRNPKIVMDTGHNIGGMQYIVRQLKTEPHNRLHIVFGMVNDKDVTAVLQLLPTSATYYFTQASIPRAMLADELRQKAAVFGLQGLSYSTVSQALSVAQKEATENDFIFVGGSTFVVADALMVFAD